MAAGSIELALSNGVVLRLPSSIEPATVAAIVNAWEQGRRHGQPGAATRPASFTTEKTQNGLDSGKLSPE
jgi:hypothetical protein